MQTRASTGPGWSTRESRRGQSASAPERGAPPARSGTGGGAAPRTSPPEEAPPEEAPEEAAPEEAAPAAPPETNALASDPKYAIYFKMLNMGVPAQAVRNKMSLDGADASVLDQM